MAELDQIIHYLRDTEKLREYVEEFSPLNPEEEGVSDFILAPWSLEAISLNTGASPDEVAAALEPLGRFTEMRKTPGSGPAVRMFSCEALPGESQPASDAGGLPGSLSVSRLMNLHVLQFVRDKIPESGNPVKIEDAIFDLKNSLFLPDDFMPEHLMGMVEGELSLTIPEIREAFQIIPGTCSIYIFTERKNNGYGRVRFLYPASRAPGTELSNEQLRKMISDSFASIQKTDEYRDFENSRLLKSVIFNMEQKKTRELRRPIFNPAKIGVLESMGLVDRNGESASVKEGITVDELKELYSRAREAGHSLSSRWLDSAVEMGE